MEYKQMQFDFVVGYSFPDASGSKFPDYGIGFFNHLAEVIRGVKVVSV